MINCIPYGDCFYLEIFSSILELLRIGCMNFRSAVLQESVDIRNVHSFKKEFFKLLSLKLKIKKIKYNH